MLRHNLISVAVVEVILNFELGSSAARRRVYYFWP